MEKRELLENPGMLKQSVSQNDDTGIMWDGDESYLLIEERLQVIKNLIPTYSRRTEKTP